MLVSLVNALYDLSAQSDDHFAPMRKWLDEFTEITTIPKPKAKQPSRGATAMIKTTGVSIISSFLYVRKSLLYRLDDS
jgi:hypothetical protein